MKKVAVLIAIVLFGSMFSFSQEKFQSGYVVLSTGDTIRGQIDFRNNWKNPDNIVFRSTGNESVVIYTPENINEFFVDRYRYISANINVDELAEYMIDSAAVPVHQKVFLMVLYEGEKSLYYYIDKDAIGHLFIPGTDVYDLLVYEERNENIITDELKPLGTNHMIRNNRYKGQLIVYFQDCPALKNRISLVKYGYSDISRLYSKYYKYTDEQPVYKFEKEKPKVSLGLLGGLTSTSLQMSEKKHSGTLQVVSNSSYNQSTMPAFGAYFELILPRNQQKWSLLTEFLYTSFDFTGYYTLTTAPNFYSNYTTSLKYSFLGVAALARYSYPVKKFRLFVDMGVRFNEELSGENSVVKEDHLYGTVVQNPPAKALNTGRHESAFMLGLGGKYGRFSVEARYYLSNGFSDYTVVTLNTNQLSLLMGFKIL